MIHRLVAPGSYLSPSTFESPPVLDHLSPSLLHVGRGGYRDLPEGVRGGPRKEKGKQEREQGKE